MLMLLQILLLAGVSQARLNGEKMSIMQYAKHRGPANGPNSAKLAEAVKLGKNVETEMGATGADKEVTDATAAGVIAAAAVLDHGGIKGTSGISAQYVMEEEEGSSASTKADQLTAEEVLKIAAQEATFAARAVRVSGGGKGMQATAAGKHSHIFVTRLFVTIAKQVPLRQNQSSSAGKR